MPQKKIVVWLLIIFVCGALIRLPHFLTVIPEAGVWSSKIAWYDEALSIHFSSQEISKTIALSGLETTPCLFVVLLHFWLLLFSSTGVAGAAVLPFLFSLAGIIAIYFLGRRIYDAKIGLFAAALLALSPLNVQYATEIRTYSLLVFLMILFLLFLWRIKDSGKPRDWIGMIICSLLLLYAHYTAIILIAFSLIFLSVVKKNETKKIIFSFLAIGAGAVPLLLIFRRWTDFLGADSASFFGRFFSHGSPLAFFQYLYFISFGSFGADGLAIILSLLIIGLFFYLWRQENNFNSRILIILTVAGWLALAALKLIFHERYYLIFTVPLILLMAAGLRAVFEKYRTAGIIGGLLFLFIFIFSGYAAPAERAYKYFAPDFAKIINSQYQAGDVIIADHYNQLMWNQYYSGPAEVKLFFPYKNELLPVDSDLRWRYSDYANITGENVALFDDLVNPHTHMDEALNISNRGEKMGVGVKDRRRFWIVLFNTQSVSIQDPQELLKEHLNGKYIKLADYLFPLFASKDATQAELLLYAAKPAN